MRYRGMIALAVAVSVTTPAAAGWFDRLEGVDGTWSTREGCDWAKASKDGWPDKVPAGFDGFSYLSATGVEGYEWGCQFVMQDRDGQGRILAVAACDAEGDSWPDTFLIERNRDAAHDGGWRLITKGEKGATNVTEYPIRCDGGRNRAPSGR